MADKKDIPPDLLEIIDSYLNNTMTTRELKDFERLLEIDDDFKRQVDYVKKMRTKSEALEKGPSSPPPKNRPKAGLQTEITPKSSRFLYYSRITALAALLIAIGGIWFFSRTPNQTTYSKYFSPAPGLSAEEDNGSSFEFYDAMANYNEGDYNLAIDKWKQLSEKQPENDSLNYFIGVAYLGIDNTEEAVPFLERAIEAEDSFPFLDNTYYYLGLAYIKEGNIDLAKKYLKLSQTERAEEVLLELEN